MEKNLLKKSDVFISYGRAESKAFASKLHNHLKEKGYEIWFDQNDIPLGVDFQGQIDDGIEKADNFIYIIAPHAVKSEYCLKEVLLAIKRNKRIIPILHIEPQTKEVWDKLHPTIGKLNWIYLRDKYDADKPPEEWEAIDDFDKGFEGLITLIEQHKPYVEKHTEILTLALKWEREKKTDELLLKGEERAAAREWLISDFEKSQPPCLPTDLHSEFICVSRKVAEKGVTDAFFCYAREDIGVREIIRIFLNRHHVTSWADTTDIKTGVNFEKAIEKGIIQADNIIYIISPHSLASQYCNDELKIAFKYNKRIIPILAGAVGDNAIHEKIRKIQYLDFTQKDEAEYLENFDKLLNVTKKDAEYYRLHKKLLVSALNWEKSTFKPNLLLHGFDLEQASDWLSENKSRRENKPIALQQKFIHESKTSRISIFVSYGRKHSKDFATKLHDRLNTEGFNVWFDQNDIPLGVDFQDQIDAGIENSDNFIFIISPHSVKSVYCLKEIVLAIECNKRIIPLLHIEPSDCWDKMHPTIEKLNWIYFQDGVNDFDQSFKGLTDLMNLHSPYVKKHTQILEQALIWDRNKRNPSILPSGKDRLDAESWLKTDFKNEQAPCSPTYLHCEFITQAKIAVDNGATEAFFSYARENAEIMNKIRTELTLQGISSWADTSDIKTGSDFKAVIKEGIEETDTILYLISTQSVNSEYCLMELEYAKSLNKRIIPILIQKTDNKFFPQEIASLQYLDFIPEKEAEDDELRKEKTKFEKDIDKLIAELHTDAEYFNRHKGITTNALRWERQKKNPGILLRGFYLQLIQGWLNTAKTHPTNRPIPLQESYIAESHDAEKEYTPEVFICSASEDIDFAEKLHYEFQNHGKICWFDQQYIDAESDRELEIKNGIESSDNFLFILSPYSAKNPETVAQFEQAKAFEKRILLALYDDVPEEETPEIILGLPYIEFVPDRTDFMSSFSELLRNLDTDRDHVKSHTKYLKISNEWIKSKKSSDFLLRGSEFEIAHAWMLEAKEEKKTPKVTELQQTFLKSCLNAIKLRQKIKRAILIIMVFLTLIAITMGIIAMQQAVIAKKNEALAVKNAEIAKRNEQKAIISEKKAVKSEKKAVKSEKKAKENERIAIENKKEAVRNALIAQANEKLAIENEKLAIKNEIIAKKNAKQATLRGLIAELNKENARFGEYKSKAAELAAQSRTLPDDAKVKPLLATLSYRMNLYAYDKLKKSVENVYEKFDKSTIGEFSEAKILVDTYNNLLERTGQVKEPPIVFAALREAFIANDISANEDVIVENTESWALSAIDNSNIIFNSKKGELLHGALEIRDLQFPKMNIKHNLTEGINIQTTTLAFTKQGLYCGTSKGSIFHWDTPSFSNKKEICKMDKQIQSSSFSNTQSALFFVSSNKLYKVTNKLAPIEIADFGDNTVRKIVIAENNTAAFVLAGTNKGKILSVDLSSLAVKEINTKFTPSGIHTIVYNKQKKMLALGNAGGSIILISGVTPESLQSNKQLTSYTLNKKHKGVVRTLAFSKNGKYFAAGSLDKSIMMWDIEGKTPAQISQLAPIFNIENENKILSLIFDTKGKFLIFSDEKNIRICPTKSKSFFNKLCKSQNNDWTQAEWNKYVGEILSKDEMEICTPK